jgi:hypothetical protein
MADGTTKAIASVLVGDEITATDPVTGETTTRTVTSTWVHDDMLLEFDIDGASLTTTEDHLFWNATDQQWQETQKLDPGDQLLTTATTTVTVGAGLDWTTAHTDKAYNLTVADIHTYYVLAGTTPVLVHNTDGELTPEQLKSIRSFERLIVDHQAKLEAYKVDPWAHDNQGRLKNAPNDAVRERIINSRINHLEKEISGWQKQINDLKKLGGGC